MVYKSYESFYGGSYSNLSPDFGEYFSGYRMNAAQLGFPGSPTTANQLGETVNALKQGVKAFEVSLLGIQDADQTIPKQHFQEMRALMTLSGVKPSVHGPVIDAAGFGERGWGGEVGRADNERRMFDAIEKAHKLDHSGKIPVVLHAANGAPGREYVPNGEEGPKMNKITAINQESGQLQQFEEENKFYPDSPETLKKNKEGKIPGVFHSALGQVESANNSEWENKLTELATFNKHADEIIGIPEMFLEGFEDAVIDRENDKIYHINEKGKIDGDLPPLTNDQKQYYKKLRDADIFLENVELNFKGAFHRAFKYSRSDEQKEALRKLADGYSERMNALEDNGKVKIWAPIEKRKILDESINILQDITERKKVIDSKGNFLGYDPRSGPPKLFMEAEEFAINKAIDTFGNLAIKSYEKFEEQAPVLAIENMYQGMAFSRAEDMMKIVDASREKLEKYLIEKRGFSEEEAVKVAEEKIGVTWDVGHLNLMKKKGFTDDDVVKETEKIKDYVKHIHLTDNFGYSDSHLPPGMGNVPIKEILKELEKNGKFNEMRKIVEAGNFVQHFKKSPHPLTLSVFGSPIYGMANAPYWNQVQDSVGNYFGGYGTINPTQHHSLYGAGFTTLPAELGGAMPGAQGGL